MPLEEGDREIAEKLDFNVLRAESKKLNAVIDKYNDSLEDGADPLAKIKVVGTKKHIVFHTWRDALDFLYKERDDIPASCVDLWNVAYPEGTGDSGEVEETEEVVEAESEGEEKEKPKAKAKSKSKTDKEKPKKAAGPSSSKSVKDFNDLKAKLENVQTPTSYFDKLCLEGGTIEVLVANFKQYIADSGINFKGLSSVGGAKGHISYRQARGWIYEEEDGRIKLVGYKG
jgi:hypothetical protein